MRKSKVIYSVLICLFVGLFSAVVSAAEEEKVYSKIPIKEVTVFKDGHSFVLHEGMVPTDNQGNVLLDSLPNPILGTFWAYSADPKTILSSVVSSRDEVEIKRNSQSIQEMIKGNIGKKVLVREINNKDFVYEAEILRVLEKQTNPVNYNVNIIGGNIEGTVLLKVAEGIKTVNFNQIQDITFYDQPSEKVSDKINKDTMTLNLDWGQRKSSSKAAVGMAYVQLGIRWIPNYRIAIDGNGKAVIKLQGTIINELADLEDVTAHLVIGVPRFAFKETPDPISMQETVAQLSSHFRTDSRTAYSFSNSIMSQQAMPRYNYDNSNSGNANELNLGPELKGMQKNEDLFVFTLKHITLKKGQRVVLPITEFELEYEDIYTVDINFAPPLEMRRNFNTDQHLQLARLFHAPKAMHKLRFTNTSESPMTTAPATIFKDGRILAQGMMTYTPIGSEGDLEITTAVDILVKHSDNQTNVTPNAEKWDGSQYSKVDMAGSVSLTNYSEKPVKLYVKRSVLGNMDTAEQSGKIKQLGHGYDGYVFEDGVPFWWSWCNWPWWWYHFNSIGQVQWELQLEPNKSIDLNYDWHYYWR